MNTSVLRPKEALTVAARAVLPSLMALGLVACGGGSSSSSGSSGTGTSLTSTGYSSASAIASAGVEYSLTNIGSLGGDGTVGTAINASGQITGYSQLAGDQYADAFLYTGGTMTDLGNLGWGHPVTADDAWYGGLYTPCGDLEYGGLPPPIAGATACTTSEGLAINDSGQVVGEAFNDVGYGNVDAFLYDGAMVNLGPSVGTPSYAYGINDGDDIIGYSPLTAEAWIYSNGGLQTLGNVDPVGINNNDQIAGTDVSQGGAFFYANETMTPLGSLGGGDGSTAAAINKDGDVVGTSRNAAGYFHAFLSAQSGSQSLIDLGVLEANPIYQGNTSGISNQESSATGINSFDDVVGNSNVTPGSNPVDPGYHAFIYLKGTMYDLNSLVDPDDPQEPYVVLTGAPGINDSDQIVAVGYDSRLCSAVVAPASCNDSQTYLLIPKQ